MHEEITPGSRRATSPPFLCALREAVRAGDSAKALRIITEASGFIDDLSTKEPYTAEILGLIGRTTARHLSLCSVVERLLEKYKKPRFEVTRDAAHFHLAIGELAVNTGRYNDGRKAFELAGHFALATNDDEMLAVVNHGNARCAYQISRSAAGGYEEALKFADDAIASADAAGINDLKARVQMIKAYVWLNKGDADKAGALIREAEDIALGDYVEQGSRLQLDAHISRYKGLYDDSITKLEKCIAIYENNKDMEGFGLARARTYLSLSLLLKVADERGKNNKNTTYDEGLILEQSYQSIREAEAICKRGLTNTIAGQRFCRLLGQVYCINASLHLEKADFEAAAEINHMRTADRALLAARILADDTNDQVLMGNVLLLRSKYLIQKTDRPDSGEVYAQKGLQIAQSLTDNRRLMIRACIAVASTCVQTRWSEAQRLSELAEKMLQPWEEDDLRTALKPLKKQLEKHRPKDEDVFTASIEGVKPLNPLLKRFEYEYIYWVHKKFQPEGLPEQAISRTAKELGIERPRVRIALKATSNTERVIDEGVAEKVRREQRRGKAVRSVSAGADLPQSAPKREWRRAATTLEVAPSEL